MSIDLKNHCGGPTENDGPLACRPLRQELGLLDSVAIVVGTIIGSGIFLLPSAIAAQLSSLWAVLLVWTLGGTLSIFGALSLAELGAMYPGTGGVCTYLLRAYGPLPAFLYAWSLLLVIHSGSIGALGVALGLYVGQILPLGLFAEKIVGATGILVLTAINYIGIRSGKLVQNFIAIAKVCGLAAIILFLNGKGSHSLQLFPKEIHLGYGGVAVIRFGIALVAVLWAYEGWHVISFVAGEIKRPQLDLPRSLLWGTAIVTLIFVLANLGYYRALLPSEIRGSHVLAAFAMERVLGRIASTLISLLIVVSVLGCMNGMILTGPRVYYAIAIDGIFPSSFRRVSERCRTPTVALVTQGAWAAALAFTSNYEQLFTNVIFTAWIFYGLAVSAVFVLRFTQPTRARPFCVPGYPWLPLLFCIGALGLILATVIGKPRGALEGFGLVFSGVPIYFFGMKRWLLRSKSNISNQFKI